jgi:hypothetical protein
MGPLTSKVSLGQLLKHCLFLAGLMIALAFSTSDNFDITLFGDSDVTVAVLSALYERGMSGQARYAVVLAYLRCVQSVPLRRGPLSNLTHDVLSDPAPTNTESRTSTFTYITVLVGFWATGDVAVLKKF